MALGGLRILRAMEPKFSELNKVRTTDERFGKWEGYVIASQFREGRWIYKLSLSEDPKKMDSFDTWIPEDSIELTK